MADWDKGSDEENEENTEQLYGGQTATIFLIEATKSMFDPDLNDKSYFAKCIECCKQYLLERIRATKTGPTAIVLFGTKKGTDPWNNIAVLQELLPPNAEKVKHLMKILESDDFDDFGSKFGHSNNFSIANALWFCHQLVSGCKTRLSEKHIIMMTCTSHPHVNDPDLQRQAKHRAISLNEASTILNVVPLGSRFDRRAFYSELTQIVNGIDESEETGVEDPSENVEEILRRINQFSQKRSTGRIPWDLGNDVKLSVAVYNLVQPKTIPPRRRLYRETNDEVQVKPQMFQEVTGEVVDNAKEKKAAEFADRKISFDASEWSGLKKVSKNGVMLVGFKPKECIKHYLTKGTFIYPDETSIKGSRTLFAAIHERCIIRGVVPICYFLPRKTSTPKLVALWPEEGKIDSNGFQIAPPGFHVIYLAFANHIRNLKSVYVKCPDSSIGEELLDVTRQMIKKLQKFYNPHAIKNPKLHTHWANIEAFALSLEETALVKDETVPDYEKMRQVLGDISEQFNRLTVGENFDSSGFAPKSKTAPSQADRPAKRPKLDLNNTPMPQIAEVGQVDKLTMDILKRYLRENGHSVTNMKKSDLVSLVYNVLGMDQPGK